MPIALVQPLLRIPGDHGDLPMDSILATAQRLGHSRDKPSVPRRLNQNAPKMSIAAFGNAAATNSTAATMLRWNQTRVGHELPRVREPADITDFGDDRRRGEKLNPPYRL